jgi:hypothetical protein
MSIVETAHFEGPEKKLKVTFAKDAPGLRSLPRTVWDQVLGAAGAAIVSAAHDEYWDAYVLSESSLFVSDHSLTLITCGQTRLVDAVAPLLSHAPRAALSQLLYARKSEHFPQHQASTFDADAKRLRALLGPSGPCAQRRLGEGEHFVTSSIPLPVVTRGALTSRSRCSCTVRRPRPARASSAARLPRRALWWRH